MALGGYWRISVIAGMAVSCGVWVIDPLFASERPKATSHLAKLARIAPGTWLDLGRPAPDPRWGRARGRSYTPHMAFAPSLNGAFLYGEGAHGWFDGKTGRYMDDLWLYDVAGHRWRNFWPGTDIRNPPNLIVNRDGFAAKTDGGPVPIATMAHGYHMTAWDTRRQLFMAMPVPHPYYWKAMPSVRKFRERRQADLNQKYASPWLFDVLSRRWARHRSLTRGPENSPGGILIYIQERDVVFFMERGQVWLYLPDRRLWQRRRPGGPPPPWSISATSCHDPKRQRIYMGGGRFPVSKGPNSLWIYDLTKDRFINPAPRGNPGGNRYSSSDAMLHCDTRGDGVVLFRYRGTGRGIYAYDPGRNMWQTISFDFPAYWQDHDSTGAASGFYHPGLDLHFFHVAGDSSDSGRILVYRRAK